MFDIQKINEQLACCANPQKETWSRGIIRTKMPMLVVMAPDINAIAKSIAQVDVVPYLEAETFKYYENTIIFAKTLHRVRDFELFKHYLYKLIPIIDNWATVDAILWCESAQLQVQSVQAMDYGGRRGAMRSSCSSSRCESAQLQVQSVQAMDYGGRQGVMRSSYSSSRCESAQLQVQSVQDCLFELSKGLLLDERPFARRVGVRILFKYLDSFNIDKTLALVKTMKSENEYYVNMCLAWLLCESFVKQREKTLAFLSLDNVSQFVLQKAVSKCCDSYRVTTIDKGILRDLLNK